MHSPSALCGTHAVEGVMTERDVTSTPKDQTQRHSESTCMMHNFKRFRAPSNIIKYDCKTNPSIWLEDYHHACMTGEVDDDLFIIQVLPIYLANSARAWLDYLPRNVIHG
jgi:hypothetical protein